MANVVSMMVKDEEFYISLALRSVIDHADVVILDTGSRDKTVDIIHLFQEWYPGKIVLIEDSFGSNDFEGEEFRFAKGFKQLDARNYLMKRTMEGRDPEDFMIHLDGDEVLNERFWEILEGTKADAICHATDLPITPYKISTHPLDMQEYAGMKLFDPHTRAWRIRAGGTWYARDEASESHPIIHWANPPHVLVTPDNVHFHLHFSFGPKSIYSYMVTTEQTAQGAAKILGAPIQEMHNQKYFEEHFPDWFEDGRFIPKNIEQNIVWSKHRSFTAGMSHPLPEMTVNAWKSWGNWIDV